VSERSPAPIPALVVSGFLGSGKTTLVRHLLEDAQRSGTRIAVVSNEFGELGIDQALLGEGGEAFVELEGGCVCCMLSDELVETLQMLYEQVQPDRIVVETSGAALPHDTQLNFWREPVASWVGDDLAAVVVDADQVASGRDLEGLFEDQVGSADLLVINKCDLVEAAALTAIEVRLEELAPGTPVVRCVRGAVDPEVLFAPDPATLRSRGQAPAHEHDGDHDHSHDTFDSEILEIEAGPTPAAIEARLDALGAIRIKGFVATSEGLRLIQGVGPRIELTPPDPGVRPPAVGQVVVIRRARD
jgi:cobalamin biosynthesis protein CobW